MTAAAAILLSAAAASLYALSTSLQALEARQAPAANALRTSLLVRLAQRRVWLAGAAFGAVGWGLQAGSLTLASVALVQPALGLGLVVLLLLGTRVLGEHVGRREVGGSLTIAAGIAVLGWAAPSHVDRFTSTGRVALVASLAVVAAAPFALRAAGHAGGLVTSLCAGLGWAWVGLGTALVDRGLAGRSWLTALAWALGVGLASWATLISEMSALQVWPATRSWPLTFALEMAVPAAVAPLLTHGGVGPAHGVPFALALVTACAGAVVLAGSRSVVGVAAAPAGAPSVP